MAVAATETARTADAITRAGDNDACADADTARADGGTADACVRICRVSDAAAGERAGIPDGRGGIGATLAAGDRAQANGETRTTSTGGGRDTNQRTPCLFTRTRRQVAVAYTETGRQPLGGC